MRSLLAGFLIILLAGCAPVAQPTATPVPVRTTTPGAPTATPVPTPIPTPSPAVVTICNTGGIGAYIRAEPKGAGVLAWPDGTKLEIVGPDRSIEGEVWRNVRDEKNNSGWTRTDYLCPVSPAPPPKTN